VSITFRAVVAQALADALKAGDAKAMAAALPEALRRRFRQHGFRVARAVPDDVGDLPVLPPEVHLEHHPQPAKGCWACEVAWGVGDAPEV
jgi:uncharacterized protein (DUF2267 family)